MAYNEDEFLMLSGIQHFAFCRRQWALIHIEQQWGRKLSDGRRPVDACESARCDLARKPG